MDVKSGRFMYQSRRPGDEAKRRKSLAKSGRVGITVVASLSHLDTFVHDVKMVGNNENSSGEEFKTE